MPENTRHVPPHFVGIWIPEDKREVGARFVEASDIENSSVHEVTDVFIGTCPNCRKQGTIINTRCVDSVRSMLVRAGMPEAADEMSGDYEGDDTTTCTRCGYVVSGSNTDVEFKRQTSLFECLNALMGYNSRVELNSGVVLTRRVVSPDGEADLSSISIDVYVSGDDPVPTSLLWADADGEVGLYGAYQAGALTRPAVDREA